MVEEENDNDDSLPATEAEKQILIFRLFVSLSVLPDIFSITNLNFLVMRSGEN